MYATGQTPCNPTTCRFVSQSVIATPQYYADCVHAYYQRRYDMLYCVFRCGDNCAQQHAASISCQHNTAAPAAAYGVKQLSCFQSMPLDKCAAPPGALGGRACRSSPKATLAPLSCLQGLCPCLTSASALVPHQLYSMLGMLTMLISSFLACLCGDNTRPLALVMDTSLCSVSMQGS